MSADAATADLCTALRESGERLEKIAVRYAAAALASPRGAPRLRALADLAAYRLHLLSAAHALDVAIQSDLGEEHDDG